MEVSSCLASEDGLRRQDLVALYKTLTQGRSGAPKLP